MRITKRIVKRILSELAQEYSIRIFYSSSNNYYWRYISGHTSSNNASLTISTNQSASYMISTFFHELGHIHCFKTGKWQAFHIHKNPRYMSKTEKSLYLRTAVKAEKWVDKWAEKEMKKHFPQIKYSPGYSDPEIVAEFKVEIRQYLYGQK
jgi:hypothetical protein